MILAAWLALSRCLVDALGLWAAWLHTCLPLVLQIRLIPDLPAVSNLAPSCFPSANALWMLWAALASHLSTNVSQYAVDALTCMVLRLPPTCLQLGTPVSARVLWVLGRTILHLCPACLPLVSDCLPVCSGCSALFPYCLHGYFGCSVPHEPTLVSYCLQISCGCSGLQEATLVSLLFSTVSQYTVVWVLKATFYFRLSPTCLPVCHAARFQKQFIVGFVGASLGW